MRLGIYADLAYRADGDGVSTDRAFILFIAALAERVDDLVLFGRLDPRPGRAPYALPEQIRFVPLPHYARITEVAAMLRGLRVAESTFAATIEALDLVWIFGPHPVALDFVRIARARHVPIVLGVRQDFPDYIARRLPSHRWAWAVPAAHLLERSFRFLARRIPAVVVGDALAARYRGNVHVTGISLVRRNAVATVGEAVGKDWHGDIRLLSVGRLDSEKNPLLLADVAAHLSRNGTGWRLIVVGEGALAPAVVARARALGVDDALELRGYVPHGDELSDLYRSSHAFLHVSTTEGLPQVLFEAQAAGLPIVATAVGGVAAALGHGARGLLIPQNDAAAAALACERLRRDPELRARIACNGLEFARAECMESQLDRLVTFLEAQLET